MSLLTKPIEQERTTAQIQAEVTSTIVRETQHTYQMLVRTYNDLMRKFWEHPKLSPQQVSDGLGTDASYLFQYGGALATLIMTINPTETALMVPKNAFTINSDGTVTITDQPYPKG